jgi:WD40 repeat protein
MNPSNKTFEAAMKTVVVATFLFAGVTCLTPMAMAQSLGAFIPTGDMKVAHGETTLTPLATGKILIAGGLDAFSDYPPTVTATAELYDPATGTFSLTGKMGTGRGCHTTTLLTNGKVLVAGGWDGQKFLASAELYDPTTGTFAATGSMIQGRCYHAATLLPDGKVLVTGGYGSSSAIAEIYDPSDGTFTAVGSMTSVRSGHVARLLASGKVLLAGGYDNQRSLASAELYDPTTGTFTATGNMTTARSDFTATLLRDGTFLIAGGSGSSSTEIYDPSTGIFTATVNMTRARYGLTATLLLDGTVLIAGGATNGSASAEIYDPATATYSPTGAMTFYITPPRCSPMALFLLRAVTRGKRPSQGRISTIPPCHVQRQHFKSHRAISTTTARRTSYGGIPRGTYPCG